VSDLQLRGQSPQLRPRNSGDSPLSCIGVAVAGLGVALPDAVIGNAPIAARLGLEEDWIVSRTGIRERHVLAPGETLVDIATAAARAALADADAEADEIDLILAATATQDEIIPNLAPLVATNLGIQAGALDVGAACSGFVSALQLAGGMLESGRARCVLVIGAEALSRFLDPDDRGTAPIFGDGAGALLLRATDGPGELGPGIMGSDAQRDFLFATRERGVIEMEGHEVFKHAVVRMSEATHAALAAAGLELDDVDLFVYHQANTRIIDAVGRRLRLDSERVVDCIATIGNLSAASLPVALGSARAEGRLPDGATVLLCAFGAGFTWGATVLDWRGTA
jgi:3-oxoacyl-[acyl-carrier-protein] synthase III